LGKNEKIPKKNLQSDWGIAPTSRLMYNPQAWQCVYYVPSIEKYDTVQHLLGKLN